MNTLNQPPKKKTYWVLALTLIGASSLLFTTGNAHATYRPKPVMHKVLISCSCKIVKRIPVVKRNPMKASKKPRRMKAVGAYCRLPKHSRNPRFIW